MAGTPAFILQSILGNVVERIKTIPALMDGWRPDDHPGSSNQQQRLFELCVLALQLFAFCLLLQCSSTRTEHGFKDSGRPVTFTGPSRLVITQGTNDNGRFRDREGHDLWTTNTRSRSASSLCFLGGRVCWGEAMLASPPPPPPPAPPSPAEERVKLQ